MTVFAVKPISGITTARAGIVQKNYIPSFQEFVFNLLLEPMDILVR